MELFSCCLLLDTVSGRLRGAREAFSQLSRGEAAALDAFERHGRLHWANGQPDAIAHAVALWREQASKHADQSTIVLAKSNADVRALNEAMRSELREAGRLSGTNIMIRATDRSGGSFELPIARGDRLEIQVRNKELGIINGTAGTVTRIEADANDHARLTLAVGTRSVTFLTAEIADAKGQARIGHAYAATIYNAQGATVDRAIVVSTGFQAQVFGIQFDTMIARRTHHRRQAGMYPPGHADRRAI